MRQAEHGFHSGFRKSVGYHPGKQERNSLFCQLQDPWQHGQWTDSIPTATKNWNLHFPYYIFTRKTIFHSVHLPKSHSFFWGQFNSHFFHGSNLLKFQYLSHTSSVANNLTVMLRKHAVLEWNSNIAIKSSLFTKAERTNLVITDRNYYIIKATGMENGQGSKMSPYAV